MPGPLRACWDTQGPPLGGPTPCVSVLGSAASLALVGLGVPSSGEK